jgi:hypothetical protein
MFIDRWKNYVIALPGVIAIALLLLWHPLQPGVALWQHLNGQLVAWGAWLAPFVILSIAAWYQTQQMAGQRAYRLIFLVVSGLIGILIMALPGTQAALSVDSSAPIFAVWGLLFALTSASFAVAWGIALAIVGYFWLDT